MQVNKIGQTLGKHKILVFLLAVLLVVAVFRAMSPKNTATGMEEEAVWLRDITTYNSFVGNVEADSERSVIAQVSAEALEVLVKVGDTVEKGDVIVRLDTTDVEYNIAQQEASLESTQTSNAYNVQDAQITYDHYKEALDSGLNSSVVSAKTQMDTAWETYEQAVDTYNIASSGIDNGTYEATSAYYSARAEAQTALEAAQTALQEGKDTVASCKTALSDAKSALAAARSDSTKTQEEVTALETAVTTAQTELTTAQSQIAALKEAVSSAKTAYQSACDQFDSAKESTLKSLSDSVSSAQTSYSNARASYDAAVLSAEQQLESYESSLEKAEGTSDTTTSELELQNLYDSLEDYTVTAPCAGTVTALDVAEGDMVTSSVSVATISNLSAMTVSITVDEYSIINTTEGSDVTIYVDSIDSTYEGTLTWIADTATIENGVSYYEAEVSFTADDLVRSGMSVEVRLTNVDEKNVLTVSADAVNYNDDNSAYVLLMGEDGETVAQNVSLGVSDGSYVQITEGLKEGDIVLVQSSSEISIPFENGTAGMTEDSESSDEGSTGGATAVTGG